MTASHLGASDSEASSVTGPIVELSSEGDDHGVGDATTTREKLISIRPITSRIAARLLRNKLVSAAERTVEIAGPSSWQVDLAVMLPDEPDRIRGHHSESSPERNMERLTSRTVTQGPTRMHLLRDALVADGAILTASSYDRIAPGARSWLLRGEFDRVDEAALCSTYVTQKYFGHWLRDGKAHELLARDNGLQPLVLDSPVLIHEPSYRRLLSLYARRTSHAHCDRLWILEDHEQNANFMDRYRRLRERLRSRVNAPDKGTERVFLARGEQAKGRAMVNTAEIKAALSKRGWTILEPEKEDAETIARTLGNARMVLSPEGSALAHAALAIPAGSGILTIIGAQHFTMSYKGLCDALGVRFGFTIGDAVDAADFRQPVDRLLRAIDLLDASIEKRATH